MTRGLLREKRLEKYTILYEIPENYTTISSGIFGGFGKYRYIILKTVSRDFNERDVYKWCRREILDKYNLPNETVVLLTCVDVNDRVRIIENVEDNTIDVVMTIGLEPVVCIDYDKIYTPLVGGTINIVVCTDTKLTPQGLLDLYRTIIEAKTIAIVDTLLECNSRPTGTMTDTLTISAPIDYKGYTTCSIVTTIGNKLSRIVYRNIIQKYIQNLENTKLEDIISRIVKNEIRYRKVIIETLWRPRRDLNPGPTA